MYPPRPPRPHRLRTVGVSPGEFTLAATFSERTILELRFTSVPTFAKKRAILIWAWAAAHLPKGSAFIRCNRHFAWAWPRTASAIREWRHNGVNHGPEGAEEHPGDTRIHRVPPARTALTHARHVRRANGYQIFQARGTWKKTRARGCPNR